MQYDTIFGSPCKHVFCVNPLPLNTQYKHPYRTQILFEEKNSKYLFFSAPYQPLQIVFELLSACFHDSHKEPHISLSADVFHNKVQLQLMFLL